MAVREEIIIVYSTDDEDLDSTTKKLEEQGEITKDNAEFFDKMNKKAVKGQKERATGIDKSVTSTKKHTQAVREQGKSVGGLINQYKGLLQGIGAAFAAKQVVDFIGEFSKLNAEVEKQEAGLKGLGVAFNVEGIAANIRALSTVTGVEFNELKNVANTTSKEFGISFEDAFNLIEEGFSKSVDGGEKLLEGMREYPAQLASIGLSAEESIAFLNQTAKEGLYSDKGVDTLKEAGIRLRENTQATADALLPLDAQVRKQIELNVASGKTFEAVRLISGELNRGKLTTQEFQTVLADVFGAPSEDAGIRFIKSLENINLNLKDQAVVISNSAKKRLEFEKAQERLIAQATGEGSAISKLTGFFQDLGTGLINLVAPQKTQADLLRIQQAELGRLVGRLKSAEIGTDDRGEAIDNLNAKFPGFLANLDAENASNEELTQRLTSVNEQLREQIRIKANQQLIADKQAAIDELALENAKKRDVIETFLIENLEKQGIETAGLVGDIEALQKAYNTNIDAQGRVNSALAQTTNLLIGSVSPYDDVNLAIGRLNDGEAQLEVKTTELEKTMKRLGSTTDEDTKFIEALISGGVELKATFEALISPLQRFTGAISGGEAAKSVAVLNAELSKLKKQQLEQTEGATGFKNIQKDIDAVQKEIEKITGKARKGTAKAAVDFEKQLQKLLSDQRLADITDAREKEIALEKIAAQKRTDEIEAIEKGLLQQQRKLTEDQQTELSDLRAKAADESFVNVLAINRKFKKIEEEELKKALEIENQIIADSLDGQIALLKLKQSSEQEALGTNLRAIKAIQEKHEQEIVDLKLQFAEDAINLEAEIEVEDAERKIKNEEDLTIRLLQIEMERLETLKEVRIAAGEDTVNLEKQIANNLEDLAEANDAKRLARLVELGGKIGEFLSTFGEAVAALDDIRSQTAENENARQQKAFEDRAAGFDKELAREDLTEKRRELLLNDQARLEEERLAAEKEAQKEAAEREKRSAIFQASLQLLVSVAKAGFITPAAIAVAIQGGILLAALIAKPIPEFAEGTDNAPGGTALVGEKGAELVKSGGKWSMVGLSGPEHVNLHPGAKVYSAHRTTQMLNDQKHAASLAMAGASANEAFTNADKRGDFISPMVKHAQLAAASTSRLISQSKAHQAKQGDLAGQVSNAVSVAMGDMGFTKDIVQSTKAQLKGLKRIENAINHRNKTPGTFST